jgi:hypothetical protein
MTKSTLKWHMVDNGDGTFDVLRRGRPVLTGVTRQKALQHLRNYPQKNEKVYERETDGYETRLRSLS